MDTFKLGSRLIVFITVLLVSVSLFSPNAVAAGKTVYVGGTMSLTGPLANESAAIFAGFEDYVKYVNETKRMAPWNNEKWPADITLELLWRDDELKPAKALSIYEELKAKGMLLYRISGSPIALALKDRLYQDKMGATSMATGPYLLKPPQTIFTYVPIYTDAMAAIAEWFKSQWKGPGKPRVAYLTADNAMGRSIEIPQMKAYLEKIGFEFVGSQYVPLVATSPPTTQLMWLKKNKVNLTLGVMVSPGSQPTIKEAVRLGMGPHLDYKIVFGQFATSPAPWLADQLGELADGVVVAAGFPPLDDLATPGIKFINDLQKRYRPTKRVTNILYGAGLLEIMPQVEAIRLALKKTPLDKLTPADVLQNGFQQIKNFSTGGLSAEPLTYGPGNIEGVKAVRLDQIQKGKVVKLGTWPTRHIY